MDTAPSDVPRSQAELPPAEYMAQVRAVRGNDDFLLNFRRQGNSPPFADALITGKPATAEMQNFEFEKLAGLTAADGGSGLADLAAFGSSMSGNDLFRDVSGGNLLLPHFASNSIGQLGEPAVNWANPASLPSLSDPALPFLSVTWPTARQPQPPPPQMHNGTLSFSPRLGDAAMDSAPFLPSAVSVHDANLLGDLPNRFQSSALSSSSRASFLSMQSSFYQSGHLPANMLKHNSSKNSIQVPFTVAEEQLLLAAVQELGTNNWEAVAARVPGHSATDCAKVWNSRLNPGIKRGQWTRDEDAALLALVENAQAQGKTIFDIEPAVLQQHVPGRSVKQVRERWRSNLDPSIVRGTWKADEDATILKMRDGENAGWAAIARMLPGRTEHSVKTRYRSIQRAEKRSWTLKEDTRLLDLVKMHGDDWETIASHLACRTPHLAEERYGVLLAGRAAASS